MFRRNLWKLSLSIGILLWAVWTLIPVQDRDFGTYLRSAVTSAKKADFDKLMTRVDARVQSKQGPSTYVALKQIARDEHIDLFQYFPSLRIEESLKNVERRNGLVLDEMLRRSKGSIQRGLDLKGGVAVTLELDSDSLAKQGGGDRQAKLSKAIEIIGARINQYGVAEPIVRAVGEDRIEVQLPGVSTRENPDLLANLVRAAHLDFRLVYSGSTGSEQMPQNVPPGYEIMSHDEEDRYTGRPYTTYYVVKSVPEMSGENVESARVASDQVGAYQVHLNFNSVGAKQFAAVTTANTGRLLAIVLDNKLYSAPRINEPITGGSAQITGKYTYREAEGLANALNNPLPVTLKIKEQYEVGPSLANDAVSSGFRAALIGTALVCAFMITFYSTGGVVAVISLGINICIIFAIMASIGATLTLPGLAGIVLTIGMAVDANILIFERMREEITAGKSLATANQSGYLKALWTILDAHAVQLIICAIMIWLGTGPIKGFGWTLLIGVLSTLFTVLITGHLLMELIVDSHFVKSITMRRMIHDLKVDFIRYGKPAAIASVALVIVSFAYVLFQGDRIYGIDFTGGDVVNVQFKEKIDSAKIREVAVSAGVKDINPTYISPVGSDHETLKLETPEGKSAAVFAALQKAYPNAGLESVGENHVGASIGKEIEWNALLAVGSSMAVILLYIAFRFEFGFGVGAMASTLHDILMNIGIFVMFGHQFSAPMVAAILCVAGYSINETVVVFDRIREELKLNPTGSLRDIINSAIRKVFARTIMTASTTFLAALSLYLFGSGVLRDISFAFLVGIVTSTFSAIFIAAQVFYWWHKGDRKHVEAHQDIAPKYEWAGSSRASR
ncbi:MAG TPA: protein translocase subunit SecD [Candidatus Didemnitutus sp.]|jgi:SecD/SecF fusion protein